ncbi:MAG TPA: response regulator [Anaerolineales bacterium]|nr:response regulator [Anaerolineales bacterium]
MGSSPAKKFENDGIPSLSILVVDDDELNQRLMRVLLTRSGHRVDVASNGLEAFEAVKRKRYDIVFMDLHMPVMDGLEASQRIRAWENGGTHTFIVALTASYLPQNGQTLFEAGMDNYIAKPFEIEHIQRLLKYSSRARLTSPSDANGAPAVGSVEQVLDTALGIQQVGGDPESYRELLADFVQELPVKIQLIYKSWEARQVEELSRAAHNLKGVGANLGATQISHLAKRLEEQSAGEYTEGLRETINDLVVAAQILSGYAKDHLKRSDN